MRIGGLSLRIVQPPAGGPQLRVEAAGEPEVEELAGALLDRGDVEQLRDACQDYLDGRPLRR